MLENLVPALKGKPVAIFGLARSGLSVASKLGVENIQVIAWDDNEKNRKEAESTGAVLKPLTTGELKECALLVLSPGVPLHFPEPHPVVKAAQAAGIEIICDIELFHRLGHGRKTIGVTGTNGKSTTTALIHHILKEAGVDAAIGGNIGLPVFEMALPGEGGVIVLELSSYQLDLCPTFRPDIAVLLNVTPDHLDRHGTMENYAASKERIVEDPGAAVIGVDDEYGRRIYERAKAKGERKVIPVSVKEDHLTKAMVQSLLKGEHNYQNALAACAACREMGVDEDDIVKGIQSFPGLSHRQFLTRTINGVAYINDSKATNADAASKALASYDDIYWIAGGQPKEGGLKGLESFAGKIRESFLIGEAMNDFAAWMKANKIPCHLCGTLDVAISDAHGAAQKNKKGVVLLSPACASWDQFSSYQERGDLFMKLVNGLEESAAA